jgi:hypothetical protein
LHLLQAGILLIQAVAPGCVLMFSGEWSLVLTRCCSRVASGLSAADRRGFGRLHPKDAASTIEVADGRRCRALFALGASLASMIIGTRNYGETD